MKKSLYIVFILGSGRSTQSFSFHWKHDFIDLRQRNRLHYLHSMKRSSTSRLNPLSRETHPGLSSTKLFSTKGRRRSKISSTSTQSRKASIGGEKIKHREISSSPTLISASNKSINEEGTNFNLNLNVHLSKSIKYTSSKQANANQYDNINNKKNRKSNLNTYNVVSNQERAKRLLGKSSSAGAWYQRDEMMQHEILTREDEAIMGSRIVKAKKLRDDMIELIEKKKLETIEKYDLEQERNLGLSWEINDLGDDNDSAYVERDEMGMEIMELHSDFETENDEDEYDFAGVENLTSNLGDENEEYIPNRYEGNSHIDFRGDRRISSTLVQDGSKLISASIDADLNLLSEGDIQNVLNVDGGKIELRSILYDGAKARNKLMRSNIRLVVSIGKKWMGRNKDNGGISDRYNGSWDRPSLDEVIQEGMLGLARAVDKYDPDRGLRFSTYSTHWITSYVRQCFQRSATGCLKVPSQLHDIKVRALIDTFSIARVYASIYLS